MSKAKLQAARELLQEKRYQEARSLLQTIPNDPTAQKWLVKLDEIVPVKPSPIRPIKAATPVEKHKSQNVKPLLALVVVVVLLIGGIWLLRRIQDNNRWESQRSEANAALTVFCFAYVSSNWTMCEQWAERTIYEDISRTDDILFCDSLYNSATTTIPDSFVSCLARRGIFLP